MAYTQYIKRFFKQILFLRWRNKLKKKNENIISDNVIGSLQNIMQNHQEYIAKQEQKINIHNSIDNSLDNLQHQIKTLINNTTK